MSNDLEQKRRPGSVLFVGQDTPRPGKPVRLNVIHRPEGLVYLDRFTARDRTQRTGPRDRTAQAMIGVTLDAGRELTHVRTARPEFRWNDAGGNYNGTFKIFVKVDRANT